MDGLLIYVIILFATFTSERLHCPIQLQLPEHGYEPRLCCHPDALTAARLLGKTAQMAITAFIW